MDVQDGVVADTDELFTAGSTNNALLIKGTHDYVAGGTFTISVKVSEDIRFQPTNGLVVDTDTGANIVLNYNVTDWLEDPLNPGTKVDLGACVAGLIDGANHVAMTEGTDCGFAAGSIGNIIKDNMKNKYDFK